MSRISDGSSSSTSEHIPSPSLTHPLPHAECIVKSSTSECLIYIDLFHEFALATPDPEQPCIICFEAFRPGLHVVRCGQCDQQCCIECMVTWLETGSSQTCPACRNSHARTSFGVAIGAPASSLVPPNITIVAADYDEPVRFHGNANGYEDLYGPNGDSEDSDDSVDGSSFYPDPFDDAQWAPDPYLYDTDSDYSEEE